MQNCVETWTAEGIWEGMNRKKTCFVEPTNRNDFNASLTEYYRVVKSGESGAAFFAVCRGKISEGTCYVFKKFCMCTRCFLFDFMHSLLADLISECFQLWIYFLIFWALHWLNDLLINWLICWLTDWVIDWLLDWYWLQCTSSRCGFSWYLCSSSHFNRTSIPSENGAADTCEDGISRRIVSQCGHENVDVQWVVHAGGVVSDQPSTRSCDSPRQRLRSLHSRGLPVWIWGEQENAQRVVKGYGQELFIPRSKTVSLPLFFSWFFLQPKTRFQH